MPVPAENTNGLSGTMTSSFSDNGSSEAGADGMYECYQRGHLMPSIPNVQMYNEFVVLTAKSPKIASETSSMVFLPHDAAANEQPEHHSPTDRKYIGALEPPPPTMEYSMHYQPPQNMILVQVNPGETFTIQGEDGTYKSISGPAQVPMVSHNGAIPPIYVPPGYISQVIEEHGVRRVIVLPSSGIDGQPAYMGSPSIHHSHPQFHPMHSLQQAHIHPATFPNMMQHCRPDDAIQYLPRPVFIPEEVCLSGLQSFYSSPDLRFPSQPPVPSHGYNLCCQPISPPTFSHLNQLDLTSLEPVDVSVASLNSDLTAQPAHLRVMYCTFRPYANSASAVQSCLVSTDSSGDEFKASSYSKAFDSQVSLQHFKDERDAYQTGFVNFSQNDMSDSSLSSMSINQSSQSTTPLSDLHNNASPQSRFHESRGLPKKLEHQTHSQQLSGESSVSVSSMTSSPASASSFASSPSGSPKAYLNSAQSNGYQPSKSPVSFTPEMAPPCNVQSHVLNIPNRNYTSYEMQQPFVTPAPSSNSSATEDDKSSADIPDEQLLADTRCYQTMEELLTAVRKPEVRDIRPRSATMFWVVPALRNISSDLKQKIREFNFYFELHLSRTKKETGNFRSVYSGKDLQYTLTDLRPATDYSVKLYTSCNCEKGPPSEIKTFRTLSCAPDPPTPPRVHTRSKNSLALKWTAPHDNGERIHKYHLEFDEESHSTGFRLVTSVSQKQFKVQKLLPSHSYLFRLAAENKVGKSAWSHTVCYQTSGLVPSTPDAPRLSKAQVKSLSLIWTKPQGEVTGYTLEMDDERTGYGFRPVYDGIELKYNVKGLARSSHYKFRVSAYNIEGKSKYSEVALFVTTPDKPRAPGKLHIKGNIHSTFFKLGWETPSDCGGSEVNHYIVEMARDRCGPFDVIHRGPEQEWTVDNLEPGHTYRLRVLCHTNGGTSAPSEALSVTTSAVIPGPCDPPMLGLRPKPTCLTIKWDPPQHSGGTSIDDYEVDCMSAAQFCSSQPSQAYKGPDLECNVGSLRPGTKYSFAVRASNKIGPGPWSDRLEAVTSPGVPEKPSAPEATVLGPTLVHLQWTAPENNGADITSYRVQWGGTEGSMSSLQTGPVLVQELQCLQPNTTYYYSIQAVNSVGPSPCSDVGCVTTPASCPGPVQNLRLCDVSDADDDIVTFAPTSSQIMVCWDEPVDNGSDINGYKIHACESKSATSEDLFEIDESQTYFCLENLRADTEYCIKVCATNEIGCGCFSQSLKVKTKSLPPDAPELTCSKATANSLHLTWCSKSKFTECTQYLLQMRDKHGRFSKSFPCLNSSFKVPKLIENTTYSFRINASNSEGTGPFSQEYAFTTQIHLPPMLDAPIISQVETTSCHVTWTKADTRYSITYRLHLSKPNNPEFNKVFKCESCSYTLTDVLPDTDYTIRVAAVRRCTPARSSFPPRDDSSSCSEVTDDGQEVEMSGPLGQSVTFKTLEPEGDKGYDEEPRVVYSPEAAAISAKTSATTSMMVAEETPVFREDTTAEDLPKTMSDEKVAAIYIAFYTLCAIFIAFCVQFIYVK